jgi:dTDP-4-amino-4,6-dideoxygalactose transaminase
MIPFSPPRIDEKNIEAVVEVLKSGWITTGPKVQLFEQLLTDYLNNGPVLSVNSATAGLELALRWFGVGEGDEVIVPAITYAATANVVLHCGAKPIFADISSADFNIDINKIKPLINNKTKVIIPVDIAGLPCDYTKLMDLIVEMQYLFTPSNDKQSQLGRILLLSDAAHSLGAIYKDKKTGNWGDIAVFSFHAVKNLTTAEGGAIVINLPSNFDRDAIYKELKIKALHGQTKDALSKFQIGNWEYDIVEAGYKFNMTDIQAAIGIVEIQRYDNDMLVKRQTIFEKYNDAFAGDSKYICPIYKDNIRKSSFHVYQLRINDCNEQMRNEIIKSIAEKQVATNVHFKPLPMMTLYKNLGYHISDYPVAYNEYAHEISLPVYYDLSDEMQDQVINAVKLSVHEICSY